MHYIVTTRSKSMIRPSAGYNHPPLVCYARTIKRHCKLTRHWLRDCDLEIVSRNMMHLDRGRHTFSGCDRFKTLGFIPLSLLI